MNYNDFKNANDLIVRCIEPGMKQFMYVSKSLIDVIKEKSDYFYLVPDYDNDWRPVLEIEVSFKTPIVIGFDYEARSNDSEYPDIILTARKILA